MKFALIFLKNLKIIFRKKTTLLVFIFLPILLMLSIGIIISESNKYTFQMGIIKSNDLSVLEPIYKIEKISINELQTLEECKELLKEGKLIGCGYIENDIIYVIIDNTKPAVAFELMTIIDNAIKKSEIEKVKVRFQNIEEFAIENKKASEQVMGDLVYLSIFLKNTTNSIDNFLVELNYIKNEIKIQKEEIARLNIVQTKIDFDLKKKNISDSLNEFDNNLFLIKSLLTVDIPLNQNLELIKDSTTKIDKYRTDIKDMKLILDKIDLLLNSSKEKIEDLDIAMTNSINEIVIIEKRIIDLRNELNNISNNLDNSIETYKKSAKKQEELFSKKYTETKVGVLKIIDVKNIMIFYSAIFTFLTIFLSVLLSNVITKIEIDSIARPRNKLLPINYFIFILASLATAILVTSILIFVFILASSLFFEITRENVINLFIVFFPTVILFSLIGSIFALLITKNEISIICTIFFAIITLIYTDIFFPMQKMTFLGSFFVFLNPAYHFKEIVTKIILFGSSFSISFIFYLIITSIVMFIILLSLYYMKYN